LRRSRGSSTRNMMNALDRAATTDLLTDLPDRDHFNRRLLPRALEEHDRVALVVDIVDFSDAMAAVTITRVRETLLRLADAVGEAVSEEAVCAVQGRRDLRHPSQHKRRGRLLAGGAGAESPDRRSGRFAFRCRDRWISGARERRWRTRRRCVQDVEYGQTTRR
jgi:hypothetical protein